MAVVNPNAVAVPVKFDHLIVRSFTAALDPDNGRKSWAFACGMAAANADGSYTPSNQPDCGADCQDAAVFIGQLAATAGGPTSPPELAPAAGAFAQAMAALDTAIQQAAAAAVNFYRLRGDDGFVGLPALTVQ